MFKKQEPTITMTASELAAFIDARFAERDAKQAEPLYESAEQEFKVRLMALLDEEEGDVAVTVARAYVELRRFVERWRVDASGEALYPMEVFEKGMLANYIRRLDTLRKSPSVLEQIAERTKLEERIAHNASWHWEFVPPDKPSETAV